MYIVYCLTTLGWINLKTFFRILIFRNYLRGDEVSVGCSKKSEKFRNEKEKRKKIVGGENEEKLKWRNLKKQISLVKWQLGQTCKWWKEKKIFEDQKMWNSFLRKKWTPKISERRKKNFNTKRKSINKRKKILKYKFKRWEKRSW